MVTFEDDEAGYLRWLLENPTGYVVNSQRPPRPAYLVLHHATCRHISSPTRTNYTTTYQKVCARSKAELERWATNVVGGQLRACQHCQP
jgi:hypothetical protein